MRRAFSALSVVSILAFVSSAAEERTAPQTYCRFVPERKDDFAWENDKVAFRAYGPASRPGPENSGIDCWLKCVDYPIIDKWYRQALQEGKSYHEDHGEGYDPYHVGSSAGCGGTALWLDGSREPLETFIRHEILECAPDRCRFRLGYEREINGVVYGETRTITITPGGHMFRVHSEFTKDGEPARDLPVCIGLTTHDGKALTHSDKAKGWIACSENIDGYWLGTAALIDPARVDAVKRLVSENRDESHILILCRTDSDGAVDYRAGFAWEKAGDITGHAGWKRYLDSP